MKTIAVECEKYDHDFRDSSIGKRNGEEVTLIVWGDCFYEIVKCSKCGLRGRQIFSNKHSEVTDLDGVHFIG